MHLICPKCGNKEFYAHLVCYVDVIVDEYNTFIDNLKEDFVSSVYEADDPYGPYTCTKCGYEFDVD